MKDLRDQLIEKQKELANVTNDILMLYEHRVNTIEIPQSLNNKKDKLQSEIASLDSRLESAQEEKKPVVTDEEIEKESILYQALYNPMTEESAWHTLSVHKTRKGAEMAIAFHKEEKIRTDGIDNFEAWGVNEMKVEK
jgi:predicted  nucleic acid-binding Zn-ribbon protein